MSNKLPAFQFYPADWRKDPGVQSLSFHDRGVWFEILCLMHESEQRGKLLLNGKAMPDDALARLLGLDKQNLTKTLTVLLDYGVASRDEQGALINRRMIKDENLRQIRTEAGKLGGNPNLVNQNSTKTKKQVNQNPTPSSSTTNSVSNETGETPIMRRIWKDGIELLTQNGAPEKQVRSLLGKLGKEFTNELLAECIAVTQAKNPVNPEEFLIGTLKARKTANSKKQTELRTDKDRQADRERLKPQPLGANV